MPPPPRVHLRARPRIAGDARAALLRPRARDLRSPACAPARGRRCLIRVRRAAVFAKLAAMHKSRLVAFGIDCQDADLDTAATFWSAALGRPVKETEGAYAALEDRANQPVIFVQRVDHPSRVHLDIETDDVEAEVARLEALGARRLEKVRTWWVMESPTGHRFCVVRPQRGPLGPDANVWP